jgi:hypothetical protein
VGLTSTKPVVERIQGLSIAGHLDGYDGDIAAGIHLGPAFRSQGGIDGTLDAIDIQGIFRGNGKIAIVMIFPYLIDQTRRFAKVTLSGSVHGHEIAAAMEAMYQDPDWAAKFDILWDASKITELLLDASDFLGFVRVQKKYAAVGPRREIIVARRNLDRAMARTYAMFMKAGAHRVYVCQSEEEANELLKQ